MHSTGKRQMGHIHLTGENYIIYIYIYVTCEFPQPVGHRTWLHIINVQRSALTATTTELTMKAPCCICRQCWMWNVKSEHALVRRTSEVETFTFTSPSVRTSWRVGNSTAAHFIWVSRPIVDQLYNLLITHWPTPIFTGLRPPAMCLFWILIMYTNNLMQPQWFDIYVCTVSRPVQLRGTWWSGRRWSKLYRSVTSKLRRTRKPCSVLTLYAPIMLYTVCY